MNGVYVKFEESGSSTSGRTKIWLVKNAKSDFEIGRIRWMSSWRKYTFEPANNCVFDANCLRDIATACELYTQQHKEELALIAEKEKTNVEKA